MILKAERVSEEVAMASSPFCPSAGWNGMALESSGEGPRGGHPYLYVNATCSCRRCGEGIKHLRRAPHGGRARYSNGASAPCLCSGLALPSSGTTSAGPSSFGAGDDPCSTQSSWEKTSRRSDALDSLSLRAYSAPYPSASRREIASTNAADGCSG